MTEGNHGRHAALPATALSAAPSGHSRAAVVSRNGSQQGVARLWLVLDMRLRMR